MRHCTLMSTIERKATISATLPSVGPLTTVFRLLSAAACSESEFSCLRLPPGPACLRRRCGFLCCHHVLDHYPHQDINSGCGPKVLNAILSCGDEVLRAIFEIITVWLRSFVATFRPLQVRVRPRVKLLRTSHALFVTTFLHLHSLVERLCGLHRVANSAGVFFVA